MASSGRQRAPAMRTMGCMSNLHAPPLKLTTTAEAIASLPALAGLPPGNSILVAPFAGRFCTRAMRIAIDAAPDEAAVLRLASTVLAELSRCEGADSVLVAAYRDEPFEEIGSAWTAALELLLERVHSAGFHIKDAAIVAADGWMPFFGAASDGLHPLSELAEGARQLPGDGQIDPMIIALPAQDAELAGRVTRLCLARAHLGAETDAFGRLIAEEPPSPVDLLERALSQEPAEANAQTLAHLLAQIDSEGAVDRTALQIAFGRDIGSLSWAHTLTLRGEAADAGCEPIDLMTACPDDRTLKRLAHLMSGRTREVPDADRLQAGAVLLGRAVAHCELRDRVWTLCALAWVRWALGLTRSAFVALEEARGIDPANPLPPVLFAMFELTTPDWLYRPAEKRRARRSRERGK